MNMVKQGAKTVVPRLRFPEFQKSDGWKPTPLGKSGTFIRGLTYGAGDVQDDGLLVIRSTNIQDGDLVLDKDLIFVGKKCLPEQTLQLGDVAICMSNGSKALVGKSAEYFGNHAGPITVGAFCSIFRPSLAFAKIAFKSDSYANYVALAIGGGNINNLKNSDLESFVFAIPISASEQQKVADCLTSLDEVIAAQGRKVEALKAHKRGLMQQLFPREGETRPRLRFPEFRDAPEWSSDLVSTLISTVTPPRKIPTSGYGAEGLLPIVDQSPDPVCGWTDDMAASIDDPLPLIVFGDHTCVLKLVEHAFAQGADGIKIISSRPCIRIRFLYYALQLDPISSSSYRRHFSLLQEKRVAFPEDLAEQQRIADCLSYLDTQITAETHQLAALKAHKQGLMQLLFPAPEAG